MSAQTKQQSPLVVLRYPDKQTGKWSYAVIQPSSDNPNVYQLASSWFDSEGEGLKELKRMREMR
jgi:hypothetical protein